MRKLALVLLLPAMVWADNCVLQDRTVTQGSVVIQERSKIEVEVFALTNGLKRCQVTFRARVGAEWHTAFGEVDWEGDRPRDDACGVAYKRAEDNVRERAGKNRVISDKVMICRDQPDLQTLRQANPGTIAALHQFRPHPDYPNRFWHNGAQCKWFLESNYVGKDIRTFQGVICQLQDSKWVVVDKF
jgi:hypothetical protein